MVWFSRLYYNFVLTSSSLSERPFLYDIMGSSLKISFSNGCCCLKCFGGMMSESVNKVLLCLFADAFNDVLILFVLPRCFLIHSSMHMGRDNVSLRRHISPYYHN